MTVLFFALLQFPMLVSVLDLNGSYSLQPELTTLETPYHFPESLALLSFSVLRCSHIFLPGRHKDMTQHNAIVQS